MLWLDTLRGDDATGVFLVDNKGNVEIAKAAVDGPTFIKSKEWAEIRRAAITRGSVLVGHNRKATRGSVTDENAHPFWIDDKLVLVQNGSFIGSHKHIADTDVDSHALAHLLAREEDIEKALQQVNSSYALMWYEVPKKQFHILRNKERPLHHTMISDTWFFTSEQSILDFVLGRMNMDKEAREVKSLSVDCLHTWTIEKEVASLKHRAIDCTFRRPENLPEPNQFVHAWRGYQNFACGYYGERSEHEEPLPAIEMGTTQTTQTSGSPNLSTAPEEIQTYISTLKHNEKYDFESMINYSRFKNLINYGMPKDTRIKVSIEDYDLMLEGSKEKAILVGSYNNYTGSTPFRVIFPISVHELQDYMCEDEEQEFYVTVSGHHFFTKYENPTDFMMGLPIIWAEKHVRVVRAS